MNARKLALSALVLAGVTAAGLTIGATLPAQGVGTSTPSPSIQLTEDDPAWDCAHMGNFTCGDLTAEQADAAWEGWNKSGGWTQLRTNCAGETKVELKGIAPDVYPTLQPTETAVVGTDANWYVFTAHCA